jgi:hypothetical protein
MALEGQAGLYADGHHIQGVGQGTHDAALAALHPPA